MPAARTPRPAEIDAPSISGTGLRLHAHAFRRKAMSIVTTAKPYAHIWARPERIVTSCLENIHLPPTGFQDQHSSCQHPDTACERTAINFWRCNRWLSDGHHLHTS